ncbi:Myb-like DNA-binding domain-containing protein [Spironucleus salmonicida]|uniref:Myb-like DNA-binding domain-containing protein n=1 Tax=Spironucleus salmonicida TaxID=348837 RepID=V6LQP9_9EUKA|nr:Myb-like DNA-binding domain-containing protein [Spironucleus salmonicida]|eukprot:EST46031.1 Myb-like DNA-binding domain-containing protein [Spironucleus salmonicida]
MPYREWDIQELDKLKSAVQQYTNKNRTNWLAVACFVKTRSARQCQDRYLNRMKNQEHFVTKTNNFHTAWKQEEEILLKELVALHGHKWTLFQEYFPGRDANKIKSKFYNVERRSQCDKSMENTQTSNIETSFSWKVFDHQRQASIELEEDQEEVDFFGTEYFDYINKEDK